jgi:hypothetical protein
MPGTKVRRTILQLFVNIILANREARTVLGGLDALLCPHN